MKSTSTDLRSSAMASNSFYNPSSPFLKNQPNAIKVPTTSSNEDRFSQSSIPAPLGAGHIPDDLIFRHHQQSGSHHQQHHYKQQMADSAAFLRSCYPLGPFPPPPPPHFSAGLPGQNPFFGANPPISPASSTPHRGGVNASSSTGGPTNTSQTRPAPPILPNATARLHQTSLHMPMPNPASSSPLMASSSSGPAHSLPGVMSVTLDGSSTNISENLLGKSHPSSSQLDAMSMVGCNMVYQLPPPTPPQSHRASPGHPFDHPVSSASMTFPHQSQCYDLSPSASFLSGRGIVHSQPPQSTSNARPIHNSLQQQSNQNLGNNLHSSTPSSGTHNMDSHNVTSSPTSVHLNNNNIIDQPSKASTEHEVQKLLSLALSNSQQRLDKSSLPSVFQHQSPNDLIPGNQFLESDQQERILGDLSISPCKYSSFNENDSQQELEHKSIPYLSEAAELHESLHEKESSSKEDADLGNDNSDYSRKPIKVGNEVNDLQQLHLPNLGPEEGIHDVTDRSELDASLETRQAMEFSSSGSQYELAKGIEDVNQTHDHNETKTTDESNLIQDNEDPENCAEDNELKINTDMDPEGDHQARSENDAYDGEDHEEDEEDEEEEMRGQFDNSVDDHTMWNNSEDMNLTSNPDESDRLSPDSDDGMTMAKFELIASAAQPDNEGLFFCHLCEFTGKTRQEFHDHLRTHYDYRCHQCDYTSRTEGRLKRHLKDFHSDVPPQNFSGKTARGMKPKTLKCKQCEFLAQNKDEYWQHQRSHIKEEKRLECPKCPFVTEYKHHLEYHIRNHFGSKPYKCPKCNYMCVNKSMLNSHMKSHTNVYQYRCADCHYATKYCHSLKLHLAKNGHRPATVLNTDGSLPEYDNSTEILNMKRGPPRGPRQTSKARLIGNNTEQGSNPGGLAGLEAAAASRRASMLDSAGASGLLNSMRPPRFGSGTDVSHSNPFMFPPPTHHSSHLPHGHSSGAGGGINPMLWPFLSLPPGFPSLAGLPPPPPHHQYTGHSQPHSSSGSVVVMPPPMPSSMIPGYSPFNGRHGDNSIESSMHLSPPLFCHLCHIKFENPLELTQHFITEHHPNKPSKQLQTQSQKVDEANITTHGETGGSALDLSCVGPPTIKSPIDIKRSYPTDIATKGPISTNSQDSESPHPSPDNLELGGYEYRSDSGSISGAISTSAVDDLSAVASSTSEPPSRKRPRKSKAFRLDQHIKFVSEPSASNAFETTSSRISTQNNDIKTVPIDANVKLIKLSEDCNDTSDKYEQKVSTNNVSKSSVVDTASSAEVSPAVTPRKEYYECQFCDILFRGRTLFDIHMGYHCHADPFLCNRCGRQSRDNVEFFTHLGEVPHAQRSIML